MRMKRLIFICMFQIIILYVYGPNDDCIYSTLRQNRPFGISAYIWGPSFAAISFELFVIPAIEINLSTGYGSSCGINFHIMGNDNSIKWSPYVGAHLATYKSFELDYFGNHDEQTRVYGLYNPVGIQYLGPKGLTLSFEGALYSTFGENGGIGPWVGLKFGYRFKRNTRK